MGNNNNFWSFYTISTHGRLFWMHTLSKMMGSIKVLAQVFVARIPHLTDRSNDFKTTSTCLMIKQVLACMQIVVLLSWIKSIQQKTNLYQTPALKPEKIHIFVKKYFKQLLKWYQIIFCSGVYLICVAWILC